MKHFTSEVSDITAKRAKKLSHKTFYVCLDYVSQLEVRCFFSLINKFIIFAATEAR